MVAVALRLYGNGGATQNRLQPQNRSRSVITEMIAMTLRVSHVSSPLISLEPCLIRTLVDS